jgi:protein arginine kinase activator
MLCDICHKNEATIHIQEIINGQKKTVHICQSCAENKPPDDPNLLNGINIAELLYKLTSEPGSFLKHPMDIGDSNPDAVSQIFPKLTCSCGWSSENFRKTGRLGCENCYKTFAPILLQALNSMHRGTVHEGKKPVAEGPSKSAFIMLDLITLQKRLEGHIKKEEYEEAAKVRDQIALLKQKSVE